MKGETVQVKIPSISGYDAHNNAIYSTETVEIDNVLIGPLSSTELSGSTRPDGWDIRYNLYFPKTFEGSLEGAEVCVRGQWLKVYGAPDYYLGGPTDWNRTVEVGITHG